MAAGNSNSPNVMSDSPIENLHQDVCCQEFLYKTGVTSVWLKSIEFTVDLQYLEIKKQKNSSFLWVHHFIDFYRFSVEYTLRLCRGDG